MEDSLTRSLTFELLNDTTVKISKVKHVAIKETTISQLYICAAHAHWEDDGHTIYGYHHDTDSAANVSPQVIICTCPQ